MLSGPSHLTDEEYYAAGHDYIGIKLKRETAEELEAKGWQAWLMKLMPFRFEDAFSDDHIKYWELCWSVLLRIRIQQKLYRSGVWPVIEADEEQWLRDRHCWIDHKEMVRLLILGRGMAKSSSIEAGAVMRACLLGAGYCLYVCESQDQAEEHLGNIRELIEHDESLILEYYPHMEVDPNAKVNGKKTKDRTDLFITKGGFIGRAKGLNANLRGLRIGGFRPDQITLDDIDGVNDSYAVSLKKFKQITATVIGTQARRWTTIDFGQNLIGENSVMNMVHTGRQDALAERTTIGVSNTFVQFREGVEYKTWMDEEDGRIKHTILPAAQPTWAGVNISQAQKFLHDSGLATFLAEYMNSFDHLKTDKVYHEYNEARHIITWSQFQAKFGYSYIPGNWRAKASGDLGYSLKSESCWFFAACSPQNTVLPSRYFAYRSKTFKQTSIDDQAIDLWQELFPDPESGKPHFEATQKFSNYPELFRLLDANPRCSPLLRRFEYDARINKFVEPKIDLATAAPEEVALFHVRLAQKGFKSQIGAWIISHEKTGEQKTLAQKYGLPVSKTKNFGKRDGIQEANHLLRGDYSVPHPFHEDEIDPVTGLYRLGSPFMFIIVDDDQIKAPKDDRGFKSFREQVAMQIWTPEKLGEGGLAQMVPFKAVQADHCFVAGTLITTDQGEIPIERIVQGDMILTRKGHRRCEAAGMTNPNAEIWQLGPLEGTANHPVYVDGKGFIPLSLVSDSDRMVSCEHGQNTTAKLSPSTASIFTAIQHRLTNIYGDIISGIKTANTLLCTSQFGFQSMGLFPTATISTTETTTRSTMIRRIWKRSQNPLTGKSTQRTTLLSNLTPISTRPEKPRKNGIDPMKAENGTGDTPSALRPIAKPSSNLSSVHFAIKGLRSLWQAGRQCIARIDANKRASTTDVRPKLVAAGSPRKTSKRSPVYNLTVAEVPEYFANGLLVHNCDAFRMWSSEYATPSSTKKTIREQYLDEIPDELRYKAPEEREPEAKIITPEMQMDMEFAQEQAREKMSKNLGLIDEDDEFGEDYGFEEDDLFD